MDQTHEHHDRRNFFAINLALAANAGLAVLKTSIGILGHSSALLADGINSTSDVAYGVIIRIFMRKASQPPDEEHPYGHRQLESIAALIIGAFVLTTAVAIFWDAVNTVFDIVSGKTAAAGTSVFTLVAALFTVGLKAFLSWKTRRIARLTRNPAVAALAVDHRNDIVSASAAGVGITLALLGVPWFDPLAGGFVALVILKTGLRILQESADDLMDTVPTAELRQKVEGTAAEIPGILRVEDMKAHRFGPYLVIHLVVAMDGGLTVSEGDALSARLEASLRENIDLLREVHIHYHPPAPDWQGSNSSSTP